MKRAFGILAIGALVLLACSPGSAQSVVGNFTAIVLSGFRVTATAAGVLVTTDGTATLTGKTYNAESTGNVITLPFTLDVPVASCYDGSAFSNWDLATQATDSPSYTCVGGASYPMAELAYDDSATESAYNRFMLPADWTGVLDLRLLWRTSATAGNVVWQVQTACVAAGATVDPSWNTAQTVTSAAHGTTGRAVFASLSSVTTTGCAIGNLFKYRILRDPTHVSDTIAATANLVAVEWTLRRAI